MPLRPRWSRRRANRSNRAYCMLMQLGVQRKERFTSGTVKQVGVERSTLTTSFERKRERITSFRTRLARINTNSWWNKMNILWRLRTETIKCPARWFAIYLSIREIQWADLLVAHQWLMILFIGLLRRTDRPPDPVGPDSTKYFNLYRAWERLSSLKKCYGICATPKGVR